MVGRSFEGIAREQHAHVCCDSAASDCIPQFLRDVTASGQRAPLPAQQAALRVGRELLTTLDQGRVHRLGAEQRMLSAVLEPLGERAGARRVSGPMFAIASMPR